MRINNLMTVLRVSEPEPCKQPVAVEIAHQYSLFLFPAEEKTCKVT